MPIQHRSQISTAISRLNQSAYGTALGAGADYRRIISDSQEVAEWSQAFEDDAGYDQGSDLAQEMWLLSHSSGFDLTPDFCFQDIGFLLKDALGGYSVSQLDAGPYQHIFTPQNVNTSRQLPSRTMLKQLGGLGVFLYRDMRNMSFRLSGGKLGRLKVAASYRGSGWVEKDPASYVLPAIVDDREYAYAQQVAGGIELATGGTAQVETATAAGTITGAGNISVIVTSANLTGSPIALLVAAAGTETPTQWAALVRAALRANTVINKRFIVGGSGTAISLTDRIRAANDATLNIALDNGTTTGITPAPSSANTTAGVAATSTQSYSCDLETWELMLDNPAVEEGYRQCSSFLETGNPESGVVRSEDLLGVRNYTFNFTARLNTGDPLRTYINAGTDLRLRIPIFGIDANDHSLIITHDRARISSVNEVPDVGGFIGINGQATLMATSGVIGLTATLVNNVVSYSS